jgi:hypothetical protein
MGEFRKPRSLFFPLLLISVGLLFFLVNIEKIEGTTWDNLLKFWPVILVIGGIDGLYKRDGWVGPLVLLGFGTVLLLGNLGILAQNGFALLLRLWPILLVAIGLDIAFGHRNMLWSTLVRIGLGLALVAGIFWLAMTTPVNSSMRSIPFEQSLDGATTSDISMTMAVGKLDLVGGADAAKLITGTAGVARGSDLDANYTKPADGTSTLALKGSGVSYIPINAGSYPWTFKINSSIPVILNIEQAVGMQSFYLESVKATELNSALAVGTIMVTIPKDTKFTGKIECAVGQVVIRIPRGSNVVIHTDTALVPIKIPSTYKHSGDTIEYLAGSGNKVTLEIDIAVGSLVIEEY